VVLVIYGNASGAPTPYHFPAVSIKSTTGSPKVSLTISFDFHQVLLVVGSFGGFGCF
jgi:hypothetical protein